MKLKAFAKWLMSIDFKIDSENTGLVLAHFIHSKYNPPTTVGLEMILSLDYDGHFRIVYDKIKNLKLVGEELKKFKRVQKEILSGPLGVFLIEKITNTNKKILISHGPLSSRRLRTSMGPEPKAHRYNTESYYQPMRTISASGLVTVDSRYAKLHEDYDDK